MKRYQIITWLIALTIVLSGCSKGNTDNASANNTNQNSYSNYQPKNTDNSSSEYDDSEDKWENTENAENTENTENTEYDEYDEDDEDTNNTEDNQINENTEYNRICRLLESIGYILDGNFDASLSCDNASMDKYSGRVLVDLGNLKLAYENDDTEAIKKFGSNLVENTNELQKLARDYIIWDTFLKQTVPEENQVFLGDDPFFRDISEGKDALICLDQLSLRIDNEEVHSYDYAYEDALLHNGSNTVIFYDWFMVEKGGIEKFSDSISSLYNEGLGATLEKWDLGTLKHDMNNFYREYYDTYGIPLSFDTGNKVFKKV